MRLRFGVSRYYLVVTHSAVTLAPFLDRAVAEELVHGRTELHLAPYRPARFAAQRGSATSA